MSQRRGVPLSPAAFGARVSFICSMVLALSGCGGTNEEGMSGPLQTAIEEARSGKSFLESSFANEPLAAGDADTASTYVVAHPDVSAYVILLALRRDAPQRYAKVPDAAKARILCDALAKLVFLNDFGYLDPSESYDAESARALIAVGSPGISCLRGLLHNANDAPLFGSEEATISVLYRYRRADFAYRYSMLILGRKPTFAADPVARDKLIAELQNELKRQR